MKKIKNVMLLLACGLIVTTIVTTSCSKDNPTPASTAPTIGSVSPNSGAIGATITITGTNLTGATVKFNGITATPTTVTATSITVAVPAGATTGNLTVTTASGTVSSAFTVSAPVLSSDDVAASNLIAHWTFDTDSKEAISHAAAATAFGVTFTNPGQIGNAATFTDGYLVYNPIDLINRDTALQSYTISMWVNMPAANADPLRSLFQITGTKYSDIWGQVDFELVNNGVVGDTLALAARQHQQDGLAPYDHGAITSVNYGNSTNKWTFITEVYNGNGNNQTMKIYANGNLLDSTEFSNVDKSAGSTQSTFRVVPTGNYPTDGLVPANKVYIGTLAFFDRGNTVGDGYGNLAPTWSAAAYPWAAEKITGKIDDIRLFNTAISAAEITELYTRGSAGH